jgi:hypothetical protein
MPIGVDWRRLHDFNHTGVGPAVRLHRCHCLLLTPLAHVFSMEFSAFNFFGWQQLVAFALATASLDLSSALQLQLNDRRSALTDVDVDLMAVLGQLTGDGGARASDFNEPGIDPEGVRIYAIAAAGQIQLGEIDVQSLSSVPR